IHFEYIEDQLDTSEQLALRNFLRQKYTSRLDLLIAISRPAIDFARTYAGEVFPGVPILNWGLASNIEGWSSGSPATAVVFDLDPRATVRFILQAQPATHQLVIVAGGSPYDDLVFLARVR